MRSGLSAFGMALPRLAGAAALPIEGSAAAAVARAA
jgi:hypothetical protein